MSKPVLVTGASTGLDESIASYLAQRRYRVYGTSRSVLSGKPFTMLEMDVTSMESIWEGVKSILRQEG